MSNGRYILDGHTAVACEDLIGWATWMEANDDARRVGLTDTSLFRVSTVFLGLDHGFGWGERKAPLHIFETMLFLLDEIDRPEGWKGVSLGYEAGDCWRCGTWDEAEKQHTAIVAATRIMEVERRAHWDSLMSAEPVVITSQNIIDVRRKLDL